MPSLTCGASVPLPAVTSHACAHEAGRCARGTPGSPPLGWVHAPVNTHSRCSSVCQFQVFCQPLRSDSNFCVANQKSLQIDTPSLSSSGLHSPCLSLALVIGYIGRCSIHLLVRACPVRTSNTQQPSTHGCNDNTVWDKCTTTWDKCYHYCTTFTDPDDVTHFNGGGGIRIFGARGIFIGGKRSGEDPASYSCAQPAAEPPRFGQRVA